MVQFPAGPPASRPKPLHAGLHYLACFVLTEARCVEPEVSWPSLLPPPFIKTTGILHLRDLPRDV